MKILHTGIAAEAEQIAQGFNKAMGGREQDAVLAALLLLVGAGIFEQVGPGPKARAAYLQQFAQEAQDMLKLLEAQSASGADHGGAEIGRH